MNYLVLAVLCIGAVKAHTPEVVSVAWAGKFPQFSFVSDFNVDDFKGKWYSIRATGSRDPGCVYYDLKVPETNQYTAFVYPKNYTMEFNKKNVDTFDEGFSVSSKFNPFVDGGELKVLLTDYSKLIVPGVLKINCQILLSKYLQSLPENRKLRSDLRSQAAIGILPLSELFVLVAWTFPQQRVYLHPRRIPVQEEHRSLVLVLGQAEGLHLRIILDITGTCFGHRKVNDF